MKFLELLTSFQSKISGRSEQSTESQIDTEVVENEEPQKFGMFQGVFTPMVIIILCMMYLFQPWVVGNAGVLGAILILVLAVSITLSTALSMASITTNIRIGRGGAFSIISQSLGLEVGGSIGLPLYFSQAFAITMYIFAFREGFSWLVSKVAENPDAILTTSFPWIVDFTTFFIVFAIVKLSTDFAFKIQYLLLAIVGASLVSMFGGLINIDVVNNFENIQWIGDFDGGNSSFWIVFAVFFPAVTGIMAGANISGELKNPRKAIPNGTLNGVVLTTIVYLALIFLAALLIKSEDSAKDFYYIFIERSYWWPIVLVGLLCASFASALSSFIGAPRILAALGDFNILPKSTFFSQTNEKGEPQSAIFFTAIIVFLSLFTRDLNAIAPLITMFFLITYAMINVVVLIEQSLGLPSFRPTFKVPIIVPLLGTVGCFFVMFIINPVFALISMGLVVTFYGYLLKRELHGQQGDSRSGLFTALAEWATKKSKKLSPRKERRAWQPELLVLVEFARELRGAYRTLYALTHPKGSVKVLGMQTPDNKGRLENYLPKLMDTFENGKIAASYSFIEGNDYGKIVSVSMQALRTAFFKPNTVFLKWDHQAAHKIEDYRSIVRQAYANDWGIIFFAPYETSLGIEKTINVWLSGVPDDWVDQLDLGNNDLSVLISLIILKNWKGTLNIIRVIDDDKTVADATEQVERIIELARIPRNTKVQVIKKSDQMWEEAESADINIIGISESELDVEHLTKLPDLLNSSCLYTLDSGEESALA